MPQIQGISYADGKIWVAAQDPATGNVTNREYAPDGTPTGREFETPWAEPFGEFWPTQLVLDPRRGWMCQGVHSYQDRIVCWDPETGEVTGSLAGTSWRQFSLLGALAYNTRDDVFYTTGGSRIFHVAGFSHPVPGAILGECTHDLGRLSGLAYHDPAAVLWAATEDAPTLHRLDPDDCTIHGTLSPPKMAQVAALSVDEHGDLWVGSKPLGEGLPSLVQALAGQDVTDLTWLETSVSEGSLAPGEHQQLELSINTPDLDPGLYEADLLLVTNGGRDLRVPVPIKLEVKRGPVGTLTGVVTDANDGTPVAGAAVTASSDGMDARVRSTTTADDGSYQLPLEVAYGTWIVTTEADRYVTETTQVTFTVGFFALYRVAGFSHAEPGAVLSQCEWDDTVGGPPREIAYSAETGIFLWKRSGDPRLFQVDPATCGEVGVLETTIPAASKFTDIALDEHGNVWAVVDGGIGNDDQVYQVATEEAPWLKMSPAGSRIAPREHQELQLTVDATQLAPGMYDVEIVLDTDAARQPRTTVQMRVTVTEPVTCTRTVTGTYADQLVVDEGVTCIADGARVTGPVTVQEGAGLVVGGATITGPVRATGAELVELAGGQVTGPVTVRGTTGRVTISGNQIAGPVQLTGNTTGEVPVFVSGNRITGPLACSGNDPAPIDGGISNAVTGRSAGQCTGW